MKSKKGHLLSGTPHEVRITSITFDQDSDFNVVAKRIGVRS